MAVTIRKIVTNIPNAVRDPKRALTLAWRRILPLGIRPKDWEASRIASWNFGALKRRAAQDVFPALLDAQVCLYRTFDRVPNMSIDVFELVILCSLARMLDARRVLEIGTYDGNTCLNLAANTREDAHIVTIDLPPDWDGNTRFKVPGLMRNSADRSEVGRQFRGTPYTEKISQVFGDSAALDWQTLGGPFDLIFIDGCHASVYVESDTQNALRHLRTGGAVVWHDYGMIKDVSDTVDAYAHRFPIHAISGTRLAVGFPGNDAQ